MLLHPHSCGLASQQTRPPPNGEAVQPTMKHCFGGHERKPLCVPLLGCQANRARRGCTFSEGWDDLKRIVEVCIPKHGLRCQSMQGDQNGVTVTGLCAPSMRFSHTIGAAPLPARKYTRHSRHSAQSVLAGALLVPLMGKVAVGWPCTMSYNALPTSAPLTLCAPSHLFSFPFSLRRRLAIVVTTCDCLASCCPVTRPSNWPFLHSLANMGAALKDSLPKAMLLPWLEPRREQPAVGTQHVVHCISREGDMGNA